MFFCWASPPSLPSSTCAQLQRRCERHLCIFSYTSSRCSTRNHSKGCTSLLLVICAFPPCSFFFSVPYAFQHLLFHPNLFSPLPSPIGSPPTFLLCSEHYPKPRSAPKFRATMITRKSHFTIFSRLHDLCLLHPLTFLLPLCPSSSFPCYFLPSVHHLHQLQPLLPLSTSPSPCASIFALSKSKSNAHFMHG